jgi:hypothetical protein
MSPLPQGDTGYGRKVQTLQACRKRGNELQARYPGEGHKGDKAREGLVAMLGPFIDTLVICTLTALVIVVTGVWTSGLNGATLTARAFDVSIPGKRGFRPYILCAFHDDSLVILRRQMRILSLR